MRTKTLAMGWVLFLAAAMPAIDGARAEGFVDLYIGGSFSADADAEIAVGPALGVPQGRIGSVDFELQNSVTGGGRVGYWLEAVPWLGLALDVSHFSAKEDTPSTVPSVFKLRVTPISALLMLRYPLLKSSNFPRGQVYTYAGVGPGVFVTEGVGELRDLDIGIPENFSDINTDVGIDARAGIKLFHDVEFWGVFLEYRFTHYEPSRFEDTIVGVPLEVEFDQLITHHFVFGVGFHF